MNKLSIAARGLRLLLAGVIVMVAGYILMTGPAPVHESFNYAMFDWRRLVAAPIVILAGIAVIIVAIMGRRENRED